jgi:hypothetical protein
MMTADMFRRMAGQFHRGARTGRFVLRYPDPGVVVVKKPVSILLCSAPACCLIHRKSEPIHQAVVLTAGSCTDAPVADDGSESEHEDDGGSGGGESEDVDD